MRYSRQREALIEMLCSTKTHPDAEWLYQKLREKYPNISLGTVYRNLRQLAENGKILELNFGSVSHFDGDITPHYHMQCCRCGCIYDIPEDSVKLTVKSDTKFEITSINLMLEGICEDCI